MIMDALRRAQWLDRELGDPRDPRGEFSYARRLEEDEAERYPSSALGALLQTQLHRHYVPRTLGGEFHSFEEVGALVRVVARRDLTIAITYAISLLGTAVVWLGGDPTQQRALAASVLEGERVSVGLTEPAFGSDLLAMTTAARPIASGYQLTGEKWLGNGLDRHRFVVVYARTARRGGPRGFSLFLIDKKTVPGGFRASGKIPTLGLRGADMNGLHFDVTLPATALIGAEGNGFEVILKALQISRTFCAALSLGALDTSLDTVLRFALQRKIYGKRVSELPQSQKLLVEAWAELLVSYSLTSLVLRALHAVPAQASVHSAIVKYLVPTLAEQAMQKLSVVYGARYYLRSSDDPGIFQKMYRDNLVVSLFDGSTQVNLFSLSHQLRALVAHAQPAAVPEWASCTDRSSEFDWNGLSLSAGGQDILLASFDAACDAVRAWTQEQVADETRGALETSIARLVQGRNQLFDAIRGLSPGAFAAGDPEVFELARRYCVVAAASAVLIDWQLNRGVMANTLADPAVLAVVLHRLAVQLGDVPLLPTPCYRDCFAALLARRKFDGQCGLYVVPPESADYVS
jgi:alkylation response protein AidB-like acyl-CoA dehydrogenase